MESSSVTNWVWWVSEWNLWLGVNVPSLRDTVVTLDPTGIDVMGISSAKEVEAVSVSSDSSRSVVLDGLVVSEPSNSLPPLVLVDLGDGIGVLRSSGVPLGGENKSSVVHRSDGLGSPVEGPPLLSVVSVVVLDSEVVLSTSSRVGDNERSLHLQPKRIQIQNWCCRRRQTMGWTNLPEGCLLQRIQKKHQKRRPKMFGRPRRIEQTQKTRHLLELPQRFEPSLVH